MGEMRWTRTPLSCVWGWARRFVIFMTNKEQAEAESILGLALVKPRSIIQRLL
jgi:hypothetical protein